MVRDSPLPNQIELPLVSVCIPAYNSESTLGETLETVLAQDYPRLDIVVSDNHSTDRTKTIVKKYAERGVRYCTPNLRPEWAANLPSYIGAYINTNFVLSQGRGDYLCLYHSDDLYEPSMVRKQVEVMEEHLQVGAVFTMARTIGEDSRPIRMGSYKLPDELRGLLTFDFPTLLNAVLVHFNFLFSSSVMIRRSVMKQMGGFKERLFLTSSDLEMWLRISRQGHEIAIIDQPLLKYRISRRQFGGQYNKLRTTLGDFYTVVDYYLNKPGVRAMITQYSLTKYELMRANDKVLCATNLLVMGKVTEARALLRDAVKWRHFVAAFKQLQWLAQMTIGLGLLISTYLGLEKYVGRQACWVYECRNAWRCKPLK